MAGDWIKFELATSDKPEVWALAEKFDIDPDAVVGKLLRVWGWFDQQTENGNAGTVSIGNAGSVTKKLLDRLVGVPDFCGALVAVGWLEESDNTLAIVNFERHNGKTAKNRAVTAKRVAKHKGKASAANSEKVTQAPLPKEEKSSTSANALEADDPPRPVDNSEQHPVKEIFDTGVKILTDAGVPEQKARQVVGQLRKSQGDAGALQALLLAKDKTDPVSYLRKIHHNTQDNDAWKDCHDWLAANKPPDFVWTDPKAEAAAKRVAGQFHMAKTSDCERIFKEALAEERLK